MVARVLGFIACFGLASVLAACGDKGTGDGTESGGSAGTSPTSGGSTSSGGTGGSAGSSGETGGTGASGGSGGGSVDAMTLFGFDEDEEGFSFEMYEPDDPTYTNVGMDAVMAWDDGPGADGADGRLRLEIPFSGYNQLCDIQLNMSAVDWSGKKLRAKVMIESGFSPDGSAPGGGYIFVKTGTAYVWGRGPTINLPPETFGEWAEMEFVLDSPDQVNPDFDPSSVVSVGIQLYTGQGGTDLPDPTDTVAYVDLFTIE